MTFEKENPSLKDSQNSPRVDPPLTRKRRLETVSCRKVEKRRKAQGEDSVNPASEIQLSGRTDASQATERVVPMGVSPREEEVLRPSRIVTSDFVSQTVVPPVTSMTSSEAQTSQTRVATAVGGRCGALDESSTVKASKAQMVQIDSLTEGIHASTLRVKIVSRSGVRKWSKTSSKGQFFEAIIADSSAETRIVAFNQIVDKFHHIFKPGAVLDIACFKCEKLKFGKNPCWS